MMSHVRGVKASRQLLKAVVGMVGFPFDNDWLTIGDVLTWFSLVRFLRALDNECLSIGDMFAVVLCWVIDKVLTRFLFLGLINLFIIVLVRVVKSVLDALASLTIVMSLKQQRLVRENVFTVVPLGVEDSWMVLDMFNNVMRRNNCSLNNVGIVVIIMNRVVVDDGTIDDVMSMVVNFVRWSVVSTVWMEVMLGITVVVMGGLFINNLMRCFIDVLVVVSVRVKVIFVVLNLSWDVVFNVSWGIVINEEFLMLSEVFRLETSFVGSKGWPC